MCHPLAVIDFMLVFNVYLNAFIQQREKVCRLVKKDKTMRNQNLKSDSATFGVQYIKITGGGFIRK